MEYSNGGTNATVHFYFWKLVGSTYKYVEQSIPLNTAFAMTNGANASVPFDAFGNTTYSAYQFVEAAINLTSFFGSIDACLGLNIKTVIVKTKASDAETAALGDFAEPIQVNFAFGTELPMSSATVSPAAHILQALQGSV
jgi:hypothetical protein